VAFPELPDDRRAQPRRYAPADSPARTQTPPDGWRGPDVGQPEDDGGRGRGWGGALPDGLEGRSGGEPPVYGRAWGAEPGFPPAERLGVMRRADARVQPGPSRPPSGGPSSGGQRADAAPATGSGGWVNGVWLGMAEAVGFDPIEARRSGSGYTAYPATPHGDARADRPGAHDQGPNGRPAEGRRHIEDRRPEDHRPAENHRDEQPTEEFLTGGFAGRPVPGRQDPERRPPRGPDPARPQGDPRNVAPRQWTPAGPPETEETGPTEVIPAATDTAETEAIPNDLVRPHDPAPHDLPVPDDAPGDVAPEAAPDDDADPDGIPGRHRRRAGASSAGKPAASYLATQRSGGKKPRTGRRRRPTFWKELPLLIVVALVLTFLIQTFLAKVYVIPSGSMETTLHGCTGCNNDRVLVDKVTFRFGDPQPGDVVVFRGPDSWSNTEFSVAPPSSTIARVGQEIGSLIGLAPPDEKDFVKRVIAVGGQTVACCDSRNRVMVDGAPLDEPYIYYLPAAGPARQIPFGPITVPDGELWVMGDSRNNSSDSRIDGHGPIPVANVIGKARLKVLPIGRFGWIDATNPQQSKAVGLGDSLPQGAPLALGMAGALPFGLLRRRRIRFDQHVEEFLPSTRRSRSRFRRGGS
jgi:signal peptidase I